MAEIKKTMFREYDIRGRVSDEELNERTTEIMGQGFATFISKKGLKEAVVGFDAREYSEKLKNGFVKGLLKSGINVTEIGMVTSPVLYFSQYHLKLKAGAMITASHNPNGWSGLKLAYDFSTTLLPEDVKEIYDIIINDRFVFGQGELKKYQGILDDYSEAVLSRIKLKKKLKVVIDCGNGTASLIAPEILKEAGCEVIEQFCDVDFSFPNHEPNPTLVEAQEALSERVKKEKADIGLAYDGDGDRIGFCDERGETVFPDQALILLARLALKEKPGSAIVFDVKGTQGLFEDIKAHGGTPIIWKTGHSYIKQKSKEVDAVLGGEGSGHIFYRYGYYDYDDAVFASLKFLEYLSGQEKSFSQVMQDIPQYFKLPTLQVDCADEIKYQIVEELVNKIKEDFGEKNVIDINGARVQFSDGWFLIRASSNLPVLVLGFEAKTKERLEEFKSIVKKYLDHYPEIGKEWKSG